LFEETTKGEDGRLLDYLPGYPQKGLLFSYAVPLFGETMAKALPSPKQF